MANEAFSTLIKADGCAQCHIIRKADKDRMEAERIEAEKKRQEEAKQAAPAPTEK